MSIASSASSISDACITEFFMLKVLFIFIVILRLLLYFSSLPDDDASVVVAHSLALQIVELLMRLSHITPD